MYKSIQPFDICVKTVERHCFLRLGNANSEQALRRTKVLEEQHLFK